MAEFDIEARLKELESKKAKTGGGKAFDVEARIQELSGGKKEEKKGGGGFFNFIPSPIRSAVGAVKDVGADALGAGLNLAALPQQVTFNVGGGIGDILKGDVGGAAGRFGQAAQEIATAGQVGGDIGFSEAATPSRDLAQGRVTKLPKGLETFANIALDPTLAIGGSAKAAAKGTKAATKLFGDDIAQQVAKKGTRALDSNQTKLLRETVKEDVSKLVRNKEKTVNKVIRSLDRGEAAGGVRLTLSPTRSIRITPDVRKVADNLDFVGKVPGVSQAVDAIAPHARNAAKFTSSLFNNQRRLKNITGSFESSQAFQRAGDVFNGRVAFDVDNTVSRVRNIAKANKIKDSEIEDVVGAILEVQSAGLDVSVAGQAGREAARGKLNALLADERLRPLAETVQEIARDSRAFVGDAAGKTSSEKLVNALQKSAAARHEQKYVDDLLSVRNPDLPDDPIFIDLDRGASPLTVGPSARRTPDLPEGFEKRKIGGRNVAMPAEVAGELDKINLVLSSAPEVAKLRSAFNKVFTFWKKTATISPLGTSFSARNMRSNIFLNWLSGVDNPAVYTRAAKFQHKVEKAMKSTGDVEQALRKALTEKEFELLTSMQETGVLGDAFFEALDVTRLRFEKGGPLERFFDFGGSMNRRVEENARIAGFFHHLDETGDVVESARIVKKHLFDYNDLTPAEKAIFKNVSPFYTFFKKNMSLQVDTILKDPGRSAFRARVVDDLTNEVGEDAKEWLQDSLNVAFPDWLSGVLGMSAGAFLTDNPQDTALQIIAQIGDAQKSIEELSNIVGGPFVQAVISMQDVVRGRDRFNRPVTTFGALTEPIVGPTRSRLSQIPGIGPGLEDVTGGIVSDEERGQSVLSDLVRQLGFGITEQKRPKR